MILAFESSCDESALALFDPQRGLAGEWVHSQIALHRTYGGVVPDLATREHLARFAPMLEAVQEESGLAEVKQVAVTIGPGLAGCLAVGMAAAKAVALSAGLPLVGVNHLRGHAFSPFIDLHARNPQDFEAALERLLPHLGLLVSGGNTLLFALDKQRRLRIIAQTVDDAAGEALDKGAKLLGMPYPGGPLIEKEARQGDRRRFEFPIGISDRSDRRFSFSGLKTSLRYRLEKMTDAEVSAQRADLCASYQYAVVRQLLRKCDDELRAAQAAGQAYASVGLSGGVANNGSLRDGLEALGRKRRVPTLIARREHTGDNAAMIAFAAWVDPASTYADADYSLSFAPALRLEA